jgi:AcrR family transcriptional regulator
MSNKEILIEQAALMMAQKGYHLFTIDALIEHTTIAKSNTYYHFANKELLGEAVLQYWANIYLLMFNNIFNNPNVPIRVTLNHYLKKQIQFQKTTSFCGNPVFSITQDLSTPGALIKYTTYQKDVCAILTNFISAGIAKDCFLANLNPQNIAKLLFSQLTFAELDCRINKNCIPIIKSTNLLNNLILIKE